MIDQWGYWVSPSGSGPVQIRRGTTCRTFVWKGKPKSTPCTSQNHERWYAFCMVFHVRWIFLTTSLRIPPESRSDEGGIRRRVVRNPSHMETIQNAFSRILYTLKHFNKAKYNVPSCRSWKPCEMDLSHNCSLHGGMSEVCEIVARTHAHGYKWELTSLLSYIVQIDRTLRCPHSYTFLTISDGVWCV